MDLRKRHRSPDSTPITTRQVESLVRLSEARARLALREMVLKEDAEDVVELMKCSLFDTYCDEFGQLDFQVCKIIEFSMHMHVHVCIYFSFIYCT